MSVDENRLPERSAAPTPPAQSTSPSESVAQFEPVRDTPSPVPSNDSQSDFSQQVAASIPADSPVGASDRPMLLKAYKPGPGFLGAIGVMLAFVFLQGLVVIPFAFVFMAHGAMPQAATVLLLESFISLGVTLAISRYALGDGFRRSIAFRGLTGTHLLLVVLLVLPLMIVEMKLSNWIDRGIWGLVGPVAQDPEHSAATAQQTSGTASSPAVEQGTGRGVGFERDRYPRLRQLFEKLAAFVAEFYGRIASQSWLVVILTGCLFPAVSEEILFRGYIGRGLVARYGVVWGSLITALLFGLMHVSPTNVISTALMSLVLQFVYLTTRSLLGPMLLHCLNNLLAFSGYKFVETQTFDLLGIFAGNEIPLMLFWSSAAVLATIGWMLIETRVRWLTPLGAMWKPGYVTAEMPPRALGAIPRRGRLRPASFASAIALFLAGAVVIYMHGIEGRGTWIHETRGYAAYERGDYEEAIRHYVKAIELDAGNPQLLLNRGYSFQSLNRLDEAIADFSAAIGLRPDLADAYASRAHAYKAAGSNELAVADLTDAMERGAASSSIYLARAEALHSIGQPERALADCDEAVRLDPDNAHAHGMRGWFLQDRGRVDEAIEAFSQAIRANPNYSYALSARAVLLRQTGRADEALDDVDRACRMNPTDHDAVELRAWLRGEMQDWAGVLEDYSTALAIEPSCSRCLNGRAWLLATCPDATYRDGSKSVNDATRACELTQWADAKIIDTLAAAQAESGDFDQAVHWQSKAVELTNSNDRADMEARLELYRSGTAYRDHSALSSP